MLDDAVGVLGTLISILLVGKAFVTKEQWLPCAHGLLEGLQSAQVQEQWHHLCYWTFPG